ncbi:hypothetical protein HOY80DRAFT_1034631 [Tuber brumale]|nr:hypothetical protein HOY80DRAFT_1034631 [Tuber brumale]
MFPTVRGAPQGPSELELHPEQDAISEEVSVQMASSGVHLLGTVVTHRALPLPSMAQPSPTGPDSHLPELRSTIFVPQILGEYAHRVLDESSMCYNVFSLFSGKHPGGTAATVDVEEGLGARAELLRTQVATKIDLQVVRSDGAEPKTDVVERKPELGHT